MNNTINLILGDCLDRLKNLPDNSVDSVVTDPPYHLTSTKQSSKGFMGKEWDGGDIAFRPELWTECLRVLKPGGHILAFSASRNYHRIASAIEDAGFEIRDQLMWIYGSGFPKSHNIGKKVEEYTGWGTALKPAHEPIVMGRKPLSEKTVVDNVLEWGTGGINVDESRIPYQQSEMDKIDFDRPRVRESANPDWVLKQAHDYTDPSYTEYNQEGRFPANVLLSEEAAENLDQHTGILKGDSPNRKPRNGGHRKQYVGTDNNEKNKDVISDKKFSDVGGASRYFYVAKASKKEKESAGKNTHPTVKPIKLMEYLIKMVTPTGGTILDPFMGSGSTGIAALQNGFDFIGIEREQEYLDIAESRINQAYQTKLEL